MSSQRFRSIALVVSVLILIYHSPSFAIHGGTKIDIKDAPWTVAIFTITTFCGGSILSKDYVLTAASCVEGQAVSEILIQYESSNLYTGRTKIVWAEMVYIFDRYRNDTLQNNIALIKTNTSMTLDQEKSKAIDLPKVEYEPEKDSNVSVSGYGDVDAKPINEKLTDTSKYDLKRADFTVQDRSECAQKYTDKYTDYETFCAKGCGAYIEQGDIGDPAVQKNESSIEVLAGFVSYAKIQNPLTIFTKVGSYVEWILEIMKKNSKS
uniref:Group 3 allergen SMIPP-S Yv4031D03 n=1 Tax=Sarcoptes scabiei TaxID=52283 RepID=Q6VPU3_SARSC|nr:group 3 allergen SMIPP-S Yv4031D03 [Sarcoptes scabiei]